MHERSFLEDDRALPPVVGVILMVALTLILAATVSAFVFGFTGLLQEPPQTAFEFDYDPGGSGECHLNASNDNDGVLTISHESGEQITADRLTIKTGSGEEPWNDCNAAGPVDVVGPSEQVQVSVVEDQDVRVIWTAQDGEQTQTIGKWSRDT